MTYKEKIKIIKIYFKSEEKLLEYENQKNIIIDIVKLDEKDKIIAVERKEN